MKERLLTVHCILQSQQSSIYLHIKYETYYCMHTCMKDIFENGNTPLVFTVVRTLCMYMHKHLNICCVHFKSISTPTHHKMYYKYIYLLYLLF